MSDLRALDLEATNKSLNVYNKVVSPESWYLDYTGTESSVVATPIYTSPDVSAYNYHTIEAVTATVKVEVSVDGTNFVTGNVVLAADGNYSATIAAGAVGYIHGKYKAIKLFPNGATATNARGAHGVI